MSPILKGELEQKLIEVKENLEKMYEYKIQATILRSKTRWYNEGEENSKYFFNLEKRHFKRKVISQLCRADNTTLTSDNDILQECVDFIVNYTAADQYTMKAIISGFSQMTILCGSTRIPKHHVKVF